MILHKIELFLSFCLLRIPSTSHSSSKSRRRGGFILFIHQPHNNHSLPTLLHHPQAPAHHLSWTALSDYHHSSAYPCSCQRVIIWHQPDHWHQAQIWTISSSAGPSTSPTASSAASSRILLSTGHGWHILASNTARADSKATVPRGDTGYGNWHDRFRKVAFHFPHPVLVHPLFCSKNFHFVIPKNWKMLVQIFSLFKTKISVWKQYNRF